MNPGVKRDDMFSKVAAVGRQIDGRDNNFNLIRIIAALAVLVAHCFPLTAGSGGYEPLKDAIGMTLGAIAVDVFFVTSGFLVAGSLMQRQRVLDFIWARALRIFPALLVMLLFTVLCIGPLFTTEPLVRYLQNGATWGYFFRSAVLVGAGDGAGLPGVFSQNPFRGVVNGSLWTLPYEVAMYAALVSGWFALRWVPGFSAAMFGRAVMLLAGVLAVIEVASHLGLMHERSTVHLAFMFFIGAACHVLRQRLAFSWWVFMACGLLLVLAIPSQTVFQLLYILFVPYLTLFLAFVPAGPIRKMNLLGDYSYGTYIYAFVVQQSVVALWPTVTPGQMLWVAAPVTLALAVCSWHLVEQRALSLKGSFTVWTRTRLKLS